MARRAAGDKDSESSYFSLREAVPPGLRTHSNSVDNLDVVYTPAAPLGSGVTGEPLREAPPGNAFPGERGDGPDNDDDVTSSDEENPARLELRLHHIQEEVDESPAPGRGGISEDDRDGAQEDRADDGGAGGSGLLDGGVLSGVSGRGGGGGTVAVRGVEGEGAGGALGAHGRELVRNGLELEALPLDDATSGKSGEVGEEPPTSSRLVQGQGGPQANAMEKAVDLGRRVSKASAGGKLEGEKYTTGRVGLVSRRASRKKWRHTGEMQRDAVGLTALSASEQRVATESSSSSDESVGGSARLSAPALKQQWEEAMRMRGDVRPGGSLQAWLGSAIADRDSPMLSPTTRGLLATGAFARSGVVSRRPRSNSIEGRVAGGPRSAAGANSALGAHPRTLVWVSDVDVTECMNACGIEFSTWERRHHCRCCGGIFCNECSGQRCLMPGPLVPNGRTPPDQTRPHRVCNNCYRELEPIQEQLQEKMSRASRYNHLNTESPARFCNSPLGMDLAHEVRKAANTLNNVLARRHEGCDCDGMNLMGGAERRISNALCHGARGLVFVTVAKAGFLYAAEGGTGLCVARLPGGEWSAPSAVGTFGVSWGLQAGVEVVDMVIPLRTDAAVEMLKNGGKVYMELDAALAVGPLGRSVASAVGARVWPGQRGAVNVAARYSLCKGLFAGVGMGAGFLRVIERVNERFYGAQVSPRSLLSGAMPRPPAASPLYMSLARLERAIGK